MYIFCGDIAFTVYIVPFVLRAGIIDIVKQSAAVKSPAADAFDALGDINVSEIDTAGAEVLGESRKLLLRERQPGEPYAVFKAALSYGGELFGKIDPVKIFAADKSVFAYFRNAVGDNKAHNALTVF